MEEKTKTQPRRSEHLNLDHSKIIKLSEKHQYDPSGFINSLDIFFSNIFREMVQTRQLQKGGKS